MSSPLVTLEDNTLIEMTVAGTGECFTALMDRHLGVVSRRIRTLVPNAADAEDVLQIATFKAWLGLSSFRSESSFRTWLIRIATNEALMLYRRDRRECLRQNPDSFDDLNSPTEATDTWLIRMEESRLLLRAVRKLPPKYRQAVILHDLQQLTMPEAATQVQATVSALKSRLFRGRQLLSKALGDRASMKQAKWHGRDGRAACATS